LQQLVQLPNVVVATGFAVLTYSMQQQTVTVNSITVNK